MLDFYATFQMVLMKACLVLLPVSLVALTFCAPIVRETFRELLEIIKPNRWSKLLAAPLVVMLCLHGMTKHHIGRVEYPYTDEEMRYLFDAGSYVTNDYVHVAFTRSPVVPNTADLHGYYRPIDSTNDLDWVEFVSTTFDSFPVPQDIAFSNAISNNFSFFTTWTPGPNVQTNGLAIVNWQSKYYPHGDRNIAAMIRTGVYVDSAKIAPNPAITNSAPDAVLLLAPLNQEVNTNE